MKRWLFLCWVAVTAAVRAAGGIADKPFSQDVSVKFRLHPDLAGAEMRKLCIDKDGVVHVLTDRGLTRLFGDMLAADRSFRPLAGKIAKDIALSRAGDLYHLFDDGWLSNAEAGAPGARFARPGAFDQIAVDSSTNLVLAAPWDLSARARRPSRLPAGRTAARCKNRRPRPTATRRPRPSPAG